MTKENEKPEEIETSEDTEVKKGGLKEDVEGSEFL